MFGLSEDAQSAAIHKQRLQFWLQWPTSTMGNLLAALQAALRRLENEDWMARVPAEGIRLAAARPNGLLNKLFTPDAAEFALDHPRRNEALQ